MSHLPHTIHTLCAQLASPSTRPDSLLTMALYKLFTYLFTLQPVSMIHLFDQSHLGYLDCEPFFCLQQRGILFVASCSVVRGNFLQMPYSRSASCSRRNSDELASGIGLFLEKLDRFH